jgi:hypothetical protein
MAKKKSTSKPKASPKKAASKKAAAKPRQLHGPAAVMKALKGSTFGSAKKPKGTKGK